MAGADGCGRLRGTCPRLAPDLAAIRPTLLVLLAAAGDGEGYGRSGMGFRFEYARLPAAACELRQEVREFLAEELRDFPAELRARTWMGVDREFSRKVAARGWLGLTWPRRYGGAERSAFERYVLIEEMLAAGAPVGLHWMGDRQSGPLLLRYGTEAQRLDLLPRFTRGEIFFCIGMSEPDTGSDLASVRSRATRTAEGWQLDGAKVWTSGAHLSDYMIGLFRTRPAGEQRHEGLSQFVVPLRTPGITIRPIRDLGGVEHVCEVTFEDAHVPAESLVGEEGGGWGQVMAELAYERSGPERFLSCHPLLVELLRELGEGAASGGALSIGSENLERREGAPIRAVADGDRARVEIGRRVARLATLRGMSISVAALLERGENPQLEASVIKDLGAVLEQELPELAQELIALPPRTDAAARPYQRALAHLVQNAPSFSLRGGTREILRGIIARGLGLR